MGTRRAALLTIATILVLEARAALQRVDNFGVPVDTNELPSYEEDLDSSEPRAPLTPEDYLEQLRRERPELAGNYIIEEQEQQDLRPLQLRNYQYPYSQNQYQYNPYYQQQQQPGLAGSGGIEGRVRSTSGNALRGARVLVDGREYPLDASGDFRIPLGPGVYEVTGSAPGYEPYAQWIRVDGSGYAVADFSILRKSYVPAGGW